MSEAVIPILGPATAILPGDFLSLVFPVKRRTAERFLTDQLELAAKVCLHDMVPDGTEIDTSVPIQVTWGIQNHNGPDGSDGMWIAHLIGKLKAATDE